MISHGHVSRDPPSNNETRQMCANPPFGLCNIRRIMFHLTYDLLPPPPASNNNNHFIIFQPPPPFLKMKWISVENRWWNRLETAEISLIWNPAHVHPPSEWVGVTGQRLTQVNSGNKSTISTTRKILKKNLPSLNSRKLIVWHFVQN